LFWNPNTNPNNISFDDNQIPRIFWENEDIKMLIINLLKLEYNSLIIIYFEKNCEKYIKNSFDNPIKKEWYYKGKTNLIG